jgi:enoyl-CoA hydratase
VAALGLGLRLLGAASARLTYDESLTWAMAAPPEARFRIGPTDHPPLVHLLVRLGADAFGDSPLGLRLIPVLLGGATVWLAFQLGRRLFGDSAGLLAAALIAVDRFHASWSRLFVEEGLLLFLEALALLLLLRARDAGRRGGWLALGIELGAAALAKETALLLLPAFALALLADARGRLALRGPGPALAAAVALALAGLELARSLAHFPAGYPGRWLLLGAWAGAPSPIATSLYLGELYQRLGPADVLDVDYAQGAAFAAFWPAGVLYLSAVAWAAARVVRRRETDGLKPPLLVFAFLGAWFSLAGGRGAFDPFWWASLTLIPAVLLAGRLLAGAWRRSAAARAALTAALVGLAVWDAAWLREPGAGAARLTREEWGRRLAADGAARLARGDVRTALDQAQLALTLDPAGRARGLMQTLIGLPEAERAAPRFVRAARRAWRARGAVLESRAVQAMRIERQGTLAVLRFDKGRGNAIDPPFVEELLEAGHELAEDDGVRGVLVASAHAKLFCPGLDLVALQSLDRGAMQAFMTRFGQAAAALYELPKPVLAGVSGHAVAGGCILALTADYRVLRRGAQIGLNEVRIGVPLPWAVSALLRATVPPGSLAKVALLGRNFADDDALAVGLADELADAEGFEAACLARLAEFAEKDAYALAVTKRYLRGDTARAMADDPRFVGEFLDGWFSAATQQRIRQTVASLAAKA